MSSSRGKNIVITSFGESHGKGIGVVIDGIPSGLKFDKKLIQNQLNRRKPGQSKITTQRNETDTYEILSGIFDGKTIGSPLAIFIKNNDAQSKDYKHLKNLFRPSHADFTYYKKYGHRDYRGGGRSSARVTAGWVAAGSICEMYLNSVSDINICAFVSQIGNVTINEIPVNFSRDIVDKSIVRCPNINASERMVELIELTQKENDSLGGVITCVVKNVPIGLGDPVFRKLNAELAHAMLSINAAKGFEIGGGFAAAAQKGSDINDEFETINGQIKTKTNFSGGIQGGISNGSDIVFKVAFKATATIGKSQKTVNLNGENITLKATGRHDPCVVPRAVTIVEALCAHVLADFMVSS